MADEGCLQPAAKRRAMNGGNDRFGCELDHIEHGIEIRALRRLAKLGDVGASNERRAVAAQDNGLHAVICDAGLEAVLQALADVPGERVYGRIVDDDDEDVAMTFGGYGLHVRLQFLGGERRVHHRADFAADGVGGRWHQLGHEDHGDVFNRVDREGGGEHAAPVKFAL